MKICPECQSREVEFRCRICSECRCINSQLSKDIYASTKEHAENQAKYNKSDKCKIVRKRAYKKWRENNKVSEGKRKQAWYDDNKEKVKLYNKKYYENKKER